MKNQTAFIGLCMISLAALSTSCSEEAGGFGSGEGRILPAVDIDTETIGSASASANSRAEVTDISKDDLSLRIAKTDGSFQKTWDKLADFDTKQTFPVGDYTVEAFYGDPADEGFEKPAFAGSQAISVADGRTTSVAMTATPSNAMFTLDYSEAFVDYMQAYSAEYVTAANTIAVSAEETRPVYVAPGNVTLNVAATTPTGKAANFKVATVAAEAGYNYCVHVDINGGEAGSATLVVTFDENLATEVVEIDLSDELLSSPAPEITADGFDPATPIEFIAGFGSDAKPTMSLVAMAGLKSVTMRTNSASLIAQGWPAEVELLNNRDANVTALGLTALGLWQQPDKMALVDFSGVLEHITANINEPVSTFELTVTDKLNRVSEPLTLTVKAESPNLVLSKLDNYVPGENLRVNLEFNGTAAQVREKVAFTYLHGVSGMTRPLQVVAVEAASRAMNSYIVTITTPELDEPLDLTATCGGVSSRCTINFANFQVAGNDNDTYATHAYVTVAGTEGNTPDVSNIKFLALAAGDTEYKEVSATNNGTYFDITGLAPATTYKLKAQIGADVCRTITLNTEAAAQLPNSDMETWSVGTKQPNGWWQVDYPNDNTDNVGPWGTMNLLTTSEGSTGVGAQACGYSAKSGTTPVTGSDAFDGTSVLIQTVGWGKDNTAWNNKVTQGFSLSAGRCDHLTVGELYYGVYDSASKSPIYGYEFASRPTSLTFKAKYIPKNSADYGVAEIRVLAEDGSLIRSNSINITSNGEYTDYPISLSYSPGLKKAAKLAVIFKSSGNSECQTINNTNLSTPPSMNASTSQGYIGSKLYVDNITLKY